MTAADFYKRTRDRPNHVPKESVRRNRDGYDTAFALDVDPSNRAHRRLDIGSLNREADEVVLAYEKSPSLAHQIQIQRRSVLMNVSPQKRADHIGVPNLISISFLLRVNTRVKPIFHKLNASNANVTINVCIDGVSQDSLIEAGFESRARDLSKRVNSRISPAGRVHGHRLAVDTGKRLRQFSLNRAAIRLNLPAVKIGSVIFEDEPGVAH